MNDAPPPSAPLAAKLHGFGPLGVLAMLIVVAFAPILEPLGVLPALAWVRLSETPWSELGFIRPKSWVATVSVGIVFGTLFKLMMKAVVMPLLGAAPINQAYHYLAGNVAALLGMMVVVIFGAGFGEELVFRGFLFERLGKLLGSGFRGKAATVLITSTMFSLIHFPGQGLAGAEQAVFTGLAFGTIYAVTESIFLPMIAHAAFDVAAVLIIYWDLETYVAHLLFK
jgi:membrane protease YdiL (CAAX protease family)